MYCTPTVLVKIIPQYTSLIIEAEVISINLVLLYFIVIESITTWRDQLRDYEYDPAIDVVDLVDGGDPFEPEIMAAAEEESDGNVMIPSQYEGLCSVCAQVLLSPYIAS